MQRAIGRDAIHGGAVPDVAFAFRARIDALYDTWRNGIAEAMRAGGKAGKVSKDASPRQVAALVVAAQMGIWGTGKSSRNEALMIQAGDALCGYLETLKS